MDIKYTLFFYFLFISFFLTLLSRQNIYAGSVTQVRYFDTYSGGIILSTDPSGIAYYRNHLFIVDSEINETGPPPPPGYFLGYNIFETNIEGSTLFNEFSTVPQFEDFEPTGICYNPKDGYFYITNDDTRRLYQYKLDDRFTLINYWNLREPIFDPSVYRVKDPEGVAVNPITGQIYISDGKSGLNGGCRVIVLDIMGSSLSFVDSFSVRDNIIDPEGVAFHENSGHLFIVSGPEDKVFEYDVSGNYLDEYDLSGFQPSTRSPQGLTFAPNSTDKSRISLYIADGGRDQSPESARIYEADLGDEISLSVQLFSFKALRVDKTIKIEWETVIHHENITWVLEKKDPFSNQFEEIARIEPITGIDQNRIFEYEDRDVKLGRSYSYRIWDINSIGYETLHDEISITASPPESFYLAQNHPNPFNSNTTIEFDLPAKTNVTIDLINTLGQIIRTLKDESLDAGHYQIEFIGEGLPSGLYIYRLKTPNFYDAKKMILIN